VDSISIVDAGGGVHEIGALDLASLNVKAYRAGSGVDYTGRVFGSATDERGNTTSERLFLRGELMARARKYRYELSGRVERRAESRPARASGRLKTRRLPGLLRLDSHRPRRARRGPRICFDWTAT
jgi:hypothetical protein